MSEIQWRNQDIGEERNDGYSEIFKGAGPKIFLFKWGGGKLVTYFWPTTDKLSNKLDELLRNFSGNSEKPGRKICILNSEILRMFSF